jgi:hypothetical protein
MRALDDVRRHRFLTSVPTKDSENEHQHPDHAVAGKMTYDRDSHE